MEHVGLSEGDSAEPVDDVYLTALAAGDETSMQGFEIEPGAAVPEHSHPHEQTGFIYEGELTFHSGGETIELEAGDSFTIPGGEPHAVENHGDVTARGVDIFSPPRTDPDWAE
jgi:quercetin dioxygenase-like cupin family protein